MIKQIPKFLNTINKENKIAEKLAKDYKIDIIISDNRYGFRSNMTKNIFICHQLQIIAPRLFVKTLNSINHSLINKFDFCWIPDTTETPNLSGKLSDYKNNRTINIGPLSRFKTPIESKTNYKYKFIGIISGPEPHKTILEKKLIKEFQKTEYNCAIINGKITESKKKIKNIDFYPHQKTQEFKSLIEQAETIICRSGYSSIMDLSILQREAILIPTPGQTEQEYLAKYHSKLICTNTVEQSNFSIEKTGMIKGKIIKFSFNNLLEKAFEKSSL